MYINFYVNKDIKMFRSKPDNGTQKKLCFVFVFVSKTQTQTQTQTQKHKIFVFLIETQTQTQKHKIFVFFNHKLQYKYKNLEFF